MARSAPVGPRGGRAAGASCLPDRARRLGAAWWRQGRAARGASGASHARTTASTAASMSPRSIASSSAAHAACEARRGLQPRRRGGDDAQARGHARRRHRQAQCHRASERAADDHRPVDAQFVEHVAQVVPRRRADPAWARGRRSRVGPGDRLPALSGQPGQVFPPHPAIGDARVHQYDRGSLAGAVEQGRSVIRRVRGCTRSGRPGRGRGRRSWRTGG